MCCKSAELLKTLCEYIGMKSTVAEIRWRIDIWHYLLIGFCAKCRQLGCKCMKQL